MRPTLAVIIIVTVFALGGLGGYVLHGQVDIQTMGSGGVSCGKWLADGRLQDRSLSDMERAWVNGYLTGRQEEGRNLTEIQAGDLEGRSAWVDNYCEANPLNDLILAARALYHELLSL